jgi:hypothetical protein
MSRAERMNRSRTEQEWSDALADNSLDLGRGFKASKTWKATAASAEKVER